MVAARLHFAASGEKSAPCAEATAEVQQELLQKGKTEGGTQQGDAEQKAGKKFARQHRNTSFGLG